MGLGVPFRIRQFPVQTPVGGWPDFETQTCYEAPDDLWVYISKKQ